MRKRDLTTKTRGEIKPVPNPNKAVIISISISI